MGKKKVLLIGWDAADWTIIGSLIAKGQMPALKRIIDNGVYGNMATMNPPYSPMLWTSVATGKTPDKHGVLGFVEIMPDLEGVRPVTTNSRKSRAIWNILHNKGYLSNLVGWWPSYPAEPINGVVISDKYQKVSTDPKKKSPIRQGVIHPDNLREEFSNLRMFPYEITQQHILPFMPRADEIDQKEDKSLQAFSKIMAHNVSVHNATTRLLRTSEWDFMAVYYDLIDHFCHSFMRYHPPKQEGISQKSYEIYKEAIVGSYRFQDMMLERKLDLIDDDTTVIVMSDHGYESGVNRILNMPSVQAAPALEHRQFGMFAAMGPNIRKNEKLFGLSLIDIAPTILHHFNLPIGQDMDGKVILEMFKNTEQPQFIESWETKEGDFGELDKNEVVGALSDHETMEQLIELGYIDRPDEKIETAIHKTKCDLKHNLAKVYIGRKKFGKAQELLEDLICEKEPIDVTHYYVDLISLNIKIRNFDKAQEFLAKVKTIKSKVKFNLFFAEADILNGMGKPAKALELLKEVNSKMTSAEVLYKIGDLQFRLNRFEASKESLEKAIRIEPDKAKYIRALADVLIELGEYEDAVDYAFTCIELVKYFPAAHYTLGRALEKMGDLKNAKIAYQTAQQLNKETTIKAKLAQENIENLESTPSNTKDLKFQYHKDQIVIVSGLPRSGTSLMMQMLSKGGSTILTDENRKADESNPKGYYEYDPVMSIHKDNSWLDKAKNKSVKIVAPLLKYVDSQFRYKIIFMTRDLNEIVKSQRVMQGKDPNTLPISLLNSYTSLLDAVKLWNDREPGVEIIYVDYKDALNKTAEVLDKVVDFIGEDLDKEAMISCIDKKLYRNRVAP